MSIPSTDHTIYGFITLCLKEQGDIAGRKEITACPCSTGGKESDAIIDWDISLWQLYGSGAGLLWEEDEETSLAHPPWRKRPSLVRHLCIPKNILRPKQILAHPLVMTWTLLFTCPHSSAASRHWSHGGEWQRGEWESEGGQTEGGRWSSSSPQSHEFLWPGQMLPHISFPCWQVAYCFPW